MGEYDTRTQPILNRCTEWNDSYFSVDKRWMVCRGLPSAHNSLEPHSLTNLLSMTSLEPSVSSILPNLIDMDAHNTLSSVVICKSNAALLGKLAFLHESISRVSREFSDDDVDHGAVVEIHKTNTDDDTG